MWILTIRHHDQEPYTLNLHPGSTIIGRRLDCDVVLSDTSVSRDHAEIRYDPITNKIEIRDLGSANSTLVNGKPVGQDSFIRLYNNDIVQLGLHHVTLSHSHKSVHTSQLLPKAPPSTIESHSPQENRTDLICQIARILDAIMDPDKALDKVTELLLKEMDADRCKIILAKEFELVQPPGFSESIAKLALDKKCPIIIPNPEIKSAVDLDSKQSIDTAICAPIISSGKPRALIYLSKTDPNKIPYTKNDLNSLEAISYLISLSLERVDLYERVNQEQRLQQLLQRHMAPERVDSLVQNYLRTGRLPGLDDAHATILFADIADSTGLAGRIGARQFGEILKRYYQNSTQLVFENGGLLDKFMGDGIMATFGMCNGGENPEERAVRTGLAMLDVIAKDKDEIRLGIGVNTGPVVSGYVTTKDRIEFTVLGEAVNVAYKLQALARPNRLLVGQSTFDAIQHSFPTLSVGPVTVKGLSYQVNAYEVINR